MINKFLFLTIYQKYLGLKIYIVLLFVVLSTLMENLGILMVLPLLNLSLDPDNPSMNNHVVSFIEDFFNIFGIEITFINSLIVIIVLFLMKGIFIFGSLALTHIYRAKLSHLLRQSILDSYSKIKLSFFLKKNTGDFLNSVTDQTTKTVDTFLYFTKTVSSVSQVMLAISFAFIVAPTSSLALLLFSLLAILLFRRLNKYVGNLSSHLASETGKLSAIVIQYFSAFKYFVATEHSDTVIKVADQSIERHSELVRKTGLASAFTGAIKDPTAIILLVSMIYIEIVVLDGYIATVLVSVVFLYKAWTSVMQLQMAWQQCLEGVGAAHFVKEELENAELHKENHSGYKQINFERQIQFKNLTFNYDKNSKTGLHEINLKIKNNEFTALVGHSGSGKTTILDMIALLHEPSGGDLLIDGISAGTLSKSGWRKAIGYVPQQPFIINDTVINNVIFSLNKTASNILEKDFLKVKEACKLANIDKVIEALPEKYNTILSEGGGNISGGQRQKIAIARELYKSPKLLIFDEATSALDSKSEKEILNAVEELRKSIGIVFVTHRLESVQTADQIYVIDNGRVLEEGTYNSLSSKIDSYMKLN